MAQAARNSLVRRSIAERIDALDWSGAEQSLSERGYAVTAPVLSPAECAELTALYSDASRFRSHIIMERYRFGIGDYKYFANPLPELVAELRSNAYPHLAAVANRWTEALGEKTSPYPPEHAAFLKICHQAEQTKPTDRKSTRLNSSHLVISYAVFCLKKNKNHLRHCGRPTVNIFSCDRPPRPRGIYQRGLRTANNL